MGKTSLAVAALHAAPVLSRFEGRRYFIACEVADIRLGVLRTICDFFGISNHTDNAAKKALSRVLAGSPCLLVLDNFESAWEHHATRHEAEELCM